MTCPACGTALAEGAAFCEACGAKVADAAEGAAAASAPVDDASPISTPTAVRPPVAVSAPQTRTCAECGGAVGADGYCEQCGAKAASERDHFREAPAPWLAGVCDRGIVHSRNEDAMALFAEPATPGRSVLVVCDGVSSSTDSDVAALAGARAARDVLRPVLPRGLGVPESVEAAALRAFVTAAEAANTAVVAHTSLSSKNPASCTFVAAVAEASEAGTLVRHAVIGDSRAYWLPDVGEGVQLTTDDSMAQLLIAGGMARAEAEAAPQAHAITKWLGKDSPDIVPVCGSFRVESPGWLLVCSDGLWNYASDPAALRAQLDVVAGASGGTAATMGPEALALGLVEFAKKAGGHDNITVALARLAS